MQKSSKFGLVALLSLLTAPAFSSPAKAHDAFQFLSSSGSGEMSYADLLADADKRIAALQRKAEKSPGDWVTRDHLASIALEKAQLTNDVKDYAVIQKALDEAFAIAPDKSGPLLTAAHFNYSIHRLEQSEKYLDKMETRAFLRGDEPLQILIAHSDNAFHRGDYEKALRGYRVCERSLSGICTTQLATYYAKTGGLPEANAFLQQALAAADAKDLQKRAWLSLELGTLMMEQGKTEEAWQLLAVSQKDLPGWWLPAERSAQLLTREGKWSEAVPVYQEVIRIANLPQHMDALAECYQHLGKPEDAAPLIAKAEQLWQEELKLFPESASGHALGHFLKFGTTPDQALSLAEQNFKTRPGGEARMLLTEAYLKANRVGDAQKMVETVLATPYKTAELYDTARKTYEATGNTEKAKEMRALCLEINPKFYS